jgi:hypothetical protein
MNANNNNQLQISAREELIGEGIELQNIHRPQRSIQIRPVIDDESEDGKKEED